MLFHGPLKVFAGHHDTVTATLAPQPEIDAGSPNLPNAAAARVWFF
jgi:hypothetical protein